MDSSAMLGSEQSLPDGKPPDKEQKPAIEYTAQAASPIVSGEVKLAIGENSFTASALFDTVEIPYAEVTAIRLEDYAVTVQTDTGDYAFSRMGEWAQRFYDALCDTYNKAVLRSLFVSGKPILTASSEYNYTEGVSKVIGSAPVHVYENSVVVLPPDLSARRVPLCFVNGMDKGDYALTLRLDTGESYTFSKLGYDTAPFADEVEKQIRKLRDKSLAAIKELDPTLTAAEASQLAKLMPEGAAAPVGKLAAIAPSFVAALESKLSETRAGDSHKAFKELCDPAQIWMGFKKNDADESTAGGMGAMLGNLTGGGSNPLAALGGLTGGAVAAEGGDEVMPDPYLLWLIAPSPDRRSAAVEFSAADTATFVYRTNAGFDVFTKQLNRALEAIGFRREVIRLSDEELQKPHNADYYMAAKRTASLQFVRSNFAGRVIHTGSESWRRKLSELWSGTQTMITQSISTQATPLQTGAKLCGECGAALMPGMKFCTGCGGSVQK